MMQADDPDERYKARSRVKLALNDLVEVLRFDGKRKRWTLALVDHVRMATFSMDGVKTLDVDWTTLRPEWVEGVDPAVAAYLRRKEIQD